MKISALLPLCWGPLPSAFRVKRIYVWWAIAHSAKTQHILPFFSLTFHVACHTLSLSVFSYTVEPSEPSTWFTTNSSTSSALLRWLRLSRVELWQECSELLESTRLDSTRSCYHVHYAVCISLWWITLSVWMPHVLSGVSAVLGSVATVQSVAIRCSPDTFLKPAWHFCGNVSSAFWIWVTRCSNQQQWFT